MEDLKRLCLDFVNSYDNYSAVESPKSFVSGFKLGIKMILEIMYDEEE